MVFFFNCYINLNFLNIFKINYIIKNLNCINMNYFLLFFYLTFNFFLFVDFESNSILRENITFKSDDEDLLLYSSNILNEQEKHNQKATFHRISLDSNKFICQPPSPPHSPPPPTPTELINCANYNTINLTKVKDIDSNDVSFNKNFFLNKIFFLVL